jgi:hypothetical protein
VRQVTPGRDGDRSARHRKVGVSEDLEESEDETSAGTVACEDDLGRVDGEMFGVRWGADQEEVWVEFNRNENDGERKISFNHKGKDDERSLLSERGSKRWDEQAARQS